MIGLDTNVLVRYFTGDDTAQSAQARALIERQLTSEDPGYVNLVVLLELAWTLSKAYRYGKGEIIRTIEALLASREVMVDREDAVASALTLFENSNIGFADALITTLNLEAACRETRTFDIRFARSGAARLVGE